MFTHGCLVNCDVNVVKDKLSIMGRLFIPNNNIGSAGAILCLPNSKYCFEVHYDLVPNEDDIIKCKDNVDLFLAIAALNDATDEGQWYIPTGRWLKSETKYFGSANRRKATVEELIEYFKTNEV